MQGHWDWGWKGSSREESVPVLFPQQLLWSTEHLEMPQFPQVCIGGDNSTVAAFNLLRLGGTFGLPEEEVGG